MSMYHHYRIRFYKKLGHVKISQALYGYYELLWTKIVGKAFWLPP